jgi:hypothetical protein
VYIVIVPDVTTGPVPVRSYNSQKFCAPRCPGASSSKKNVCWMTSPSITTSTTTLRSPEPPTYSAFDDQPAQFADSTTCVWWASAVPRDRIITPMTPIRIAAAAAATWVPALPLELRRRLIVDTPISTRGAVLRAVLHSSRGDGFDDHNARALGLFGVRRAIRTPSSMIGCQPSSCGAEPASL